MPMFKNIDKKFLKKRSDISIKNGYSVQKWILFCQKLLDLGFEIDLYDSRRTVSKYVHVKFGKYCYKVRFSNHKPNREKELTGDCDFFVGVTNKHVSTTKDAFISTIVYFKGLTNGPQL
jgi:hypothetical protein